MPNAEPSKRVRSLATYRAKRDFAKTPEPRGRAKRPSKARGFVVQMHDASRLHYDFRLEHRGVLLSWSVPKGPSLRPSVRRLAVRTEDHPREYADFEGVIPKGEYGAGTVIVWDRGTWQAENDVDGALAKGHLVFTLDGEKLHGRFHLVRTKSDGDKHENWLLFKGKDDFADARSNVVAEKPESVLSGRTLDQVEKTPGRVWHSRARGKAVTKPPAAPARRRSRPAKKAPSDVVDILASLPLPFSLSNLDKVLYPEANVRKAELVAYYASIASVALPYFEDRPLMLLRCPNGRAEHCFHQKHESQGVPKAVVRVPIDEGKGFENYLAVRDLEGLVALAQLGVLEIHTWGCHAGSVERPDQLVFDLDPDEALDFDEVIDAALLVRARLEALDLESFVKTTGGKGLHVVVPLDKQLDWDAHYEFSRAFAESLRRAEPDRFVTNVRKDVRAGKILLDYMRNARGATAVAPYSTRAREGAPVATPLGWSEVVHGLDPTRFDLFTVLERTSRVRDPWRTYSRTKQKVPKAVLAAL